MKLFMILAVLLMLLTGCTDPEGAEKALRRYGFKDIQTTGYQWFGGSHGDMYVTGFVATAPNGERVKGVVSSGLFRGSNIRVE